MSQAKELLQRIAALRLRLDQAQGLARAVLDRGAIGAGDTGKDVALLEAKAQTGAWHHTLLDGALRQYEKPREVALPGHLTHRAAKVVRKSHSLLQELKALADDSILANEDDALADLHRGSAGMIDTVMRAVQVLPSSATGQVCVCEGLEAVLGVVTDRLGTIKTALGRRSVQNGQIDRLADLLRRIITGQSVSLTGLHQLALEVVDEAKRGLPLRFLHAPPVDAGRAIAAHCLNVAQVIARVTYGDAAWLGRELDGVTAALVHDVGMLSLPGEILTQTEPLTETQRRLIERHPLAGAQALVALWPGGGWPIDAAADHHERCDGVGYPRGKRDMLVSDDVKLIAICDVYAAMAAPRAHRPAFGPRTALVDTMFLADQGKLDRRIAERLLVLSFYPTGSAVLLDDGTAAVVVAPQEGAKALLHPARPIVLVAREPQGQVPPLPRILDLTVQTQRSIIRSLTAPERRRLIGSLYPELA